MNDATRKLWLAGQWITIQPTGSRFWVCRRLLERGHIEQDREIFYKEKSAQVRADYLNTKRGGS